MTKKPSINDPDRPNWELQKAIEETEQVTEKRTRKKSRFEEMFENAAALIADRLSETVREVVESSQGPAIPGLDRPDSVGAPLPESPDSPQTMDEATAVELDSNEPTNFDEQPMPDAESAAAAAIGVDFEPIHVGDFVQPELDIESLDMPPIDVAPAVATPDAPADFRADQPELDSPPDGQSWFQEWNAGDGGQAFADNLGKQIELNQDQIIASGASVSLDLPGDEVSQSIRSPRIDSAIPVVGGNGFTQTARLDIAGNRETALNPASPPVASSPVAEEPRADEMPPGQGGAILGPNASPELANDQAPEAPIGQPGGLGDNPRGLPQLPFGLKPADISGSPGRPAREFGPQSLPDLGDDSGWDESQEQSVGVQDTKQSDWSPQVSMALADAGDAQGDFADELLMYLTKIHDHYIQLADAVRRLSNDLDRSGDDR